ncbi:MAG: hypothetical protein A2Y33_04625 [Spirochaetes bacterium GWF1_51_8]|nr:MAG: hypothetical protein A2Y33_04625 [Spirochaetes bacterium GWF1_51_8]
MEENIFDVIIQLEEDLAVLYKQLAGVSRFASLHDVFEFMVKQASSRGLHTRAFIKELQAPAFNTGAVKELQKRLKDSLFVDTLNEPDINNCLEKLSNAEDVIGKLYMSIAEYYGKVADYYMKLGAKVEAYSNEEFVRRDMLKKRKH